MLLIYDAGEISTQNAEGEIIYLSSHCVPLFLNGIIRPLLLQYVCALFVLPLCNSIVKIAMTRAQKNKLRVPLAGVDVTRDYFSVEIYCVWKKCFK